MPRFEFATIRQKHLMPGTPSQIYEAYVNPKKHEEFTGSVAAGSPRVGSAFTAWDGYIFGKFVELQKDRRVVQEWSTTEWPPGYPPSILTLTFARKGKGTELQMVHSRVPKKQAEGYAEGWIESYWDPLKEYLGHGEG